MRFKHNIMSTIKTYVFILNSVYDSPATFRDFVVDEMCLDGTGSFKNSPSFELKNVDLLH